MSGKLSFLGDTIKAMSLQRIQKDLNRLYTEARGEIGNLDAVFTCRARGNCTEQAFICRASRCSGFKR